MARDELFIDGLIKCPRNDLTGRVFDKLTVIKLVGRRIFGTRKTGCALWECRCECGNIKNIPATQLLRGRARSCSCYIRKYRSINMRNKFDEQFAAKTQIYLSYKNGASKRNIPFTLNKDQILLLVSKNCTYCGSEPSNVKKLKHREGFKYNGIDRVNNELGYIEDNVVTCCETCNKAKLEMSKTDFLNWIKKVYFNIIGENQ